MKHSKFAVLGCVLLAGVLSAAQATEESPHLLNFSITGWTSSSSPSENATYAMTHREVQRLLLAIADKPRDRAFVEDGLRGSNISVENMISNGALRFEEGRYWLNFSLLTRADQDQIRRAAVTFSQSLANALLKRRAEIDNLLKQYDLDGVDRNAVAFFVLGCMSLDWDGLKLSTEKGYRAQTPKRKNGEYFVMAEEVGGLSLKQIYWGSNNGGNGKYMVTTFGDHFSPRQSLRDAVPQWLREAESSQQYSTVGTIMFALRDGPQTFANLTAATQLASGRLEEVLTALQSAGWLEKRGSRYRALIPVLTARDKQLVLALLKIGREEIETWLANNYDEVRASLDDISPVRNRVAYPIVFDQVWHYLFGIANQDLVRAGLFFDPYDRDVKRPGYVVAVWEQGINLAP